MNKPTVNQFCFTALLYISCKITFWLCKLHFPSQGIKLCGSYYLENIACQLCVWPGPSLMCFLPTTPQLLAIPAHWLCSCHSLGLCTGFSKTTVPLPRVYSRFSQQLPPLLRTPKASHAFCACAVRHSSPAKASIMLAFPKVWEGHYFHHCI